MVLAFSNIRTPRPREAESAEARLQVRRHDPDAQGRRGKKSGEEDSPRFSLLEDSAEVSLESLKTFLESLISNHEFAPAPRPVIRPGPLTGTPYAQVPLRRGPYTAQAAAYQTAAKAAPIRIPPADAAQINAAQPPNGLTASDIDVLRILLQNVKNLILKGKSSLQIEPGASFVDSLVTAVAKAGTQ